MWISAVLVIFCKISAGLLAEEVAAVRCSAEVNLMFLSWLHLDSSASGVWRWGWGMRDGKRSDRKMQRHRGESKQQCRECIRLCERCKFALRDVICWGLQNGAGEKGCHIECVRARLVDRALICPGLWIELVTWRVEGHYIWRRAVWQAFRRMSAVSVSQPPDFPSPSTRSGFPRLSHSCNRCLSTSVFEWLHLNLSFMEPVAVFGG